MLYGRELPFVRSATHLGKEMSEDETMEMETKEKVAVLITKSLEVREQFSFAHPMCHGGA